MKTDGLRETTFFPALQLFTVAPCNLKYLYLPDIKYQGTGESLLSITAWAVDHTNVWWKWWQMKGRAVWGCIGKRQKVHTRQLFMSMLICLRVSLNAHLHCCHKCPSAAQESKTGFDYCRKINWQCSKYVIFSSERIDGRGWMDGWKDASTRLFSPPRYNHSCVIKSFGLPHYSTALHFVFDSTLPHSANRLLILALFPIRAHAF